MQRQCWRQQAPPGSTLAGLEIQTGTGPGVRVCPQRGVHKRRGLDSAMTPAADDVCCFCGRPEDAAVPGELAALLTAARPRLKALRFHEACAGYSTGIAAGRLVGGSRTREPWRHGEIPAQRVAAERSRGASLECDVCGGRGATLACRGIAACGRSYHLPCAREAAQRGGVVFSLGVLECACAQHADGWVLPCLGRALGLALCECRGHS